MSRPTLLPILTSPSHAAWPIVAAQLILFAWSCGSMLLIASMPLLALTATNAALVD